MEEQREPLAIKCETQGCGWKGRVYGGKILSILCPRCKEKIWIGEKPKPEEPKVEEKKVEEVKIEKPKPELPKAEGIEKKVGKVVEKIKKKIPKKKAKKRKPRKKLIKW